MPKRADTDARERGSRRGGGNDRGGNDRGGNDRGGNDRGGNDRGATDRDRDRTDTARRGVEAPGGKSRTTPEPEDRLGPERDNGTAPPAHNGGTRRLSGSRAAIMARQQVEDLLGVPVETITGLFRHADGFTVMLEVIEIERVPRTTDIMATYRVELTPEGELDGYERVNRYYRNQTNGGGEE